MKSGKQQHNLLYSACLLAVMTGCSEWASKKSSAPIEVRRIPFIVEPTDGFSDESVISERVHQRIYSSIMLVPPSGTAGPAFDPEYSAAEGAMMRRGIELISPAVTGRVVGDDRTGGSGEAGLELSDLERVLLLADRSNADAVLQIGAISMSQPKHLGVDRESDDTSAGFRYFKLSADTVVEITSEEYDALDRLHRWRFAGPVVRLRAKLIDVESGYILALFHYEADLCRLLPKQYKAELVLPSGVVESLDWKWSDAAWAKEAARVAFAEIFDRIASHLALGPNGSQ